MRGFKKRNHLFLLITFLLFTQSGCALLTAPFTLVGQIVKMTGQIVTQAISVANKLPKPPPGVF